jgi:hypothetical protein
MNQYYIPGEGCECSARCSCECGCDVDWTPREVYELRDKAERYRLDANAMMMQRDMLAEALRELCETLLNDKPRDITESLYKAGDALAAWKGGSDDN